MKSKIIPSVRLTGAGQAPQKNKLKRVNTNYAFRFAALLIVLLSFTSCEVIGDIFQAGMGVGIFLVILVIAVIVWIISRFKK